MELADASSHPGIFFRPEAACGEGSKRSRPRTGFRENNLQGKEETQ